MKEEVIVLGHVEDRDIARKICEVLGDEYFYTRYYVLNHQTGIRKEVHRLNKYINLKQKNDDIS